MEIVEFPDEIRSVVAEFDATRQTRTLLRARFRAGKSGAFVGLVDCQGQHDGVFVLKIDSKTKGEREEEKHRRALNVGAFQEKIPKIVDSFQTADWHALLLRIAGGSRISWRPLLESPNLFASGYAATAQALWSPQYSAFGSQENGTTLVPDTLGLRLSVSQGEILHHARTFLGTEISSMRAFHHIGEIFPNPLHFALNSNAYSAPLFRPLTGHCHGDCHADNIIAAIGYDGTVHDIALIDLAYFREDLPFYYDTSYLELATLLRKMDSIGQERWRNLASLLAQGDKSAVGRLEQFERAWASDIFLGRAAVQGLIEKKYVDRKDDLTLQSLLCQVAVGLAFINKPPREESGSFGLSRDQYRQAFVWAAVHLKKFFDSAHVAWIPSTDQILPIGQQQEEIDVSNQQWRTLVQFDLSSFNVLILSPLARSANEVIVRELLRLSWNLIIDLGTSSLSDEHSSVRQGTVRQAWPLGSPLDLSVLGRGALWYFGNGRADISDAPPANSTREWRQKYLMPLQGLLGAIAQKVAPPCVRSLVIGDDFPQDFFRFVLEALDNYLGPASQPVLVATTALSPLSDVPMSCVPLAEVSHAIQAAQDPVAPDLAEGVLLPHRTERGIHLASVAPEMVNRIGRDLQIVHRALADSFPPGRTFGADFRRGQLIEWSELDNNLDVERQNQLASLLSRIRADLAKSTNSTINLLHEPSAGGTTLSRRVAWSLFEEYPVALLLQMSKNTHEYLSELFQECGLPLLVVMEAEVVTESERELLFRELLDSNTRTVFLWVSRIYGKASGADVLRAELDDTEAESFRVAYEQDISPERAQEIARLTFDPALREQRNPFFYGLVAFEDSYLGLDRLLDEIVKPLDSVGREVVADLALVSVYCSEGFPAAEFDALCAAFCNGERPFRAISPFTVNVAHHIKIPHRLIAARTLRLLARVPDHSEADLGRFALTLLQHLRSLKLHESDRLKEMVTSVFVTRDTTAVLTADTDILAGGLPRQRRFAPLIHDLGSVEIARKILKRVFNDWPNEPHFAVHYARHLLYEEPREIEHAMRVADLSRRTELGKSDDTVIHTLGMCYRIRMGSTLKAAREERQSFSAVESTLESDSGSALKYFSTAASINPISEYGHLSTIQTVSALLRGATELSGTDLAGLLKGRRWLTSALELAEESITALQARPGSRLSVRSRRIIAEWSFVYGQVEKVIQQLRALSESQQDAGVHRALCSALLTKYKRRWISVPDGDLQTITRLMERNIESTEFSDSDLSRWLRASRLRRGFDINTAIERLIDWHKLRPDAVEPAFYLHVFYLLQWLNTGRTNEGYIGAVKKWLDVCRHNRPMGNKQWSYEWLVERGGRFNAVHFADLEFDPVQTIIGRAPQHSDRLKQLGRLEGTLSRYVGPQHALVDLGQHFTIHITPRSELVRDHEGQRLRTIISFSYDGPIGWDPVLVQI